MNKYLDVAVAMTSVCSLGLATLSITEDGTYLNYGNTLKNIQAQKLEGSFSKRFDISNLFSSVAQTNPQALDSQGITPSVAEIALVNKNPSPASPTKTQSIPISPHVMELIKEFEGFEEQAYIDTDGTPVIGYGLSKIAGKPVQIGDRISSTEADAALKRQLQEIQQQLKSSIKVELSEKQLSALSSLSFNVGVDFIKQSTLVQKLNAGDYNGAADEFLRWDKANVNGRLVQLPGLTRRRQAERQLFLD